MLCKSSWNQTKGYKKKFGANWIEKPWHEWI